MISFGWCLAFMAEFHVFNVRQSFGIAIAYCAAEIHCKIPAVVCLPQARGCWRICYSALWLPTSGSRTRSTAWQRMQRCCRRKPFRNPDPTPAFTPGGTIESSIRVLFSPRDPALRSVWPLGWSNLSSSASSAERGCQRGLRRRYGCCNPRLLPLLGCPQKMWHDFLAFACEFHVEQKHVLRGDRGWEFHRLAFEIAQAENDAFFNVSGGYPCWRGYARQRRVDSLKEVMPP